MKKIENEPKNPYEKYENMTDEELIYYSRLHNDSLAKEFILYKYKALVRIKSKKYFLVGAETEDIVQEGMIGLYKALRDYRDDKLASFRAFADLCITRQIITAIKTATRQKHIPLNSYVSLNKPLYEEESDRTLLDVIASNELTNPEMMIISREEFMEIEDKMNEILSKLEWQVLISYIEGRTYQEIADELDRPVKSVDNALQRVKKKIETFLKNRGENTDLASVYSGLVAIYPEKKFDIKKSLLERK